MLALLGCDGSLSGGGPRGDGGAFADGAADGAADAIAADGTAPACTEPGSFPAPERSAFPFRTPEFSRVMNADEVGGLVTEPKLYAYAYGPAIMKENGRTHLYACTPGIVGVTWDHIRYVYSDDDGATWSAPVVVLESTHIAFSATDYSACDPSIVWQNGYYYLFYSGAENVAGPVSAGSDPSETVRTVIRVARSTSPAGPFEKYTARNTWEVGAPDPRSLVAPAQFTKGQYGVGQQSVVRVGGNLYMWYTDDTGPGGLKIRLRIAPTPEEFNYHYVDYETDNGLTALDVRYDVRSQRFVSLGVPTYLHIAALMLRYSADGLTWTTYPKEIVEATEMRHYARVEGGFTGDRDGNTVPGRTLVSFAAPHLNPDGSVPSDAEIEATALRGPYWDLFALPVDDLSERLFDVCE